MAASRRQLALIAGAVAVGQAWAFGAGAKAALASAGPGSTAPPAAASGPAPQPSQALQSQPAASAVVLSNERTATTWAHPIEEAGIRAQPTESSRTIAHVHLVTEDGYPEVYLLLASFTDSRGHVWVHLRTPGRPNGRTGWASRSAFGPLHVTRWLLLISLSQRSLRVYYEGKLRFTAPVGVGKPSTPTPTGHFWIRERFKLPARSSPYWPYALGTSAYSRLTDWPGGGVVGIHGDFGDPKAIPGDPSHGCVRMRDADLARLAPRLQLGTPVHIVR